MFKIFKKKKDEKERFEKEILPHLDAVFSFAFFYVHNYEEANDLAQETMLKAFRFYNTFKEGTNVKAWLFKILHNSFINIKKKISREKLLFEETETEKKDSHLLSDESMFYSTPEEIIISEVSKEEIMNALNTIPSDYRVAVMMCDVEGFSYKEIGEILDCPIGTVMSRIYRGRSFLKEKLRRKFKVNDAGQKIEEVKQNGEIVSFLNHKRNET